MSLHRLDIALPPGYRRQDAIAFHGRDREALAERVSEDRLRKGVLLDGAPVLLDIAFEDGWARCSVDVANGLADADGAPPARAQAALLNTLGLRIDPAPFACAVQDDPLFGPLVRRVGSLRVIQSATVFEALTWAIMGQQINVAFAIALRRSFILLAGRRHPDGLWCYPEAADVARLDVEQLTPHKFSRAKAETLLRLARLAADGAVSLDRDADLGGISARLLAVKGIGPWTVNYALLRGYGYPDCSLHGDVAVRSAIGRLLDMPERPSMAEAEAFLQNYRPHRTMAAAYLWASLG
ncbi:DNA-3-methyladenine glycosylase 2 [Massilia forsythiae]|uniref:DNA-3-methyladenine glycosylase II n=1 Tax=Massilia forsythiae TaxID=2728020 RepID=A0A7Z2ZSU3_9BURK|nr:DNA-3-methyladenine glycosylase 2 [Massilia forsythiae]QJE00866.1 DNA-3-methyladenine glycosylase 2 [Massilia forsythiae]